MKLTGLIFIFFASVASAQVRWTNVDSLYQPLPASVHVYRTNDSLDGKPNIACYVIVDLKDRQLNFTTDTTDHRRMTPDQFFQRNNHPLLVVNCSFFEYTHNSNLNVIMRNGKVIAPNIQSIPLKGKDTLKYAHVYPSAIGISKNRTADVAWTFNGTNGKMLAFDECPPTYVDSSSYTALPDVGCKNCRAYNPGWRAKKWKMQTAVGGGPVLLQGGQVHITNNEERKFGGKGINDKHPRTAMGYTADQHLIILVVQGRFTNIAEGASLTQEARLLRDLGCVEALNLDGGGSSCLLVNGKETIKPSEKDGQRSVPAVFMITTRK